MDKSDNFYKYKKFRKQFQRFSYESYEFRRLQSSIEFSFSFNLDNIYYFRPSYSVPLTANIHLDKLSDKDLSGLIFHIGMVELISYWKAACPETVEIKPALLNDAQKKWWKHLYFHGLGEFFYLNSIQASEDDFMNIICESGGALKKTPFVLEDANLIAVGGGKDSAVTIEMMEGYQEENLLLIINPRKACLDTATVAGYTKDQIIEIRRTLDPVLLKMNDEGFLNGHTPFSALLAFVSLFASAITRKKNILLSNESSANESTVGGLMVNHQYSKSYQFENDFRNYVKEYISDDFNYFSFLRPINELQIAKIFSAYPKYHSVFRSCNAGSKADCWCGQCPKCLFTAIILSPFLDSTEIQNIFGRDLLNDPKLLFPFKQLYGVESTKPFECVGTIDDVNAALVMTLKKSTDQLPFLLQHYKDSPAFKHYSNLDVSVYLKQFSKEHFLNGKYESILKAKMDD